MGHDVFISHKTEDKEIAAAACGELERKGISCWIAYRDEESGKGYAAQITDAIAKARIMVFILSSASNRSPDFVKRELQCAVGERCPIVVFRVENVTPSKSYRFYIESEHWFTALPTPSDEHYKRLFSIVRRLFYEQDIESVKTLLKKHKWVLCIKECGAILEKAMRDLLQDLLDWSQDKCVRDTIRVAQTRIKKDKSSFHDLGLAELVKLYRTTNVFGELRKMLTSSLQKIKAIDWDKTIHWYAAVVKGGASTNIRANQARKIFHYTKLLLYDCELAGEHEFVEREGQIFPEKCNACKRPLEEGWNYCPQCGMKISLACEGCSRLLKPDWKRCPYCETPVRPHPWEADDTQRARNEYRMLCKGVYIDKVVNIRERRELEAKRLQLGLESGEAREIEREVAPREIWEYMQTVDSVLVDGIIDTSERKHLDKKAKQLGIDPWVQNRIDATQTSIRNGALNDLYSHGTDTVRIGMKGRRSIRKNRKTKRSKRQKAIKPPKPKNNSNSLVTSNGL